MINEETHKRKIKRYRFTKDINKKLNQLIVLDNWHGIIALLYDYAVIFFAIHLYFMSPYFYPITLLFIGSRQGALSNLLHESAHSRLAHNKTLNYVLGTYLSGYLIFQEYYTFIASHIKSHHHHLGDQEKDPDYYFHINSGLYKPVDHDEFFKKYIFKPLCLGHVYDYTKHIFLHRAPTFSKYKRHAIKMGFYLGTIALIFLYLGMFKYFVMFWIVPFFTVFPLCSNIKDSFRT